MPPEVLTIIAAKSMNCSPLELQKAPVRWREYGLMLMEVEQEMQDDQQD